MRALPIFGTLAVGLLLCGSAAAQNTSSLYKSNYASTATSGSLYNQNYGSSIKNPTRPTGNDRPLTSTKSSKFSLRDLFSRVPSSTGKPNASVGPVTDPGKPEEYLKSFGFQRTSIRR